MTQRDKRGEKMLRDSGFMLMWEEKGPRLTQIAFQSCWLHHEKGRMIIMQEYKDGHGFQIYGDCPHGDLQKTEAWIRDHAGRASD